MSAHCSKLSLKLPCYFSFNQQDLGWQSGFLLEHRSATSWLLELPHIHTQNHTHTNISSLPTPTLLLLCTNVFRAFSHKQGLQGVPAAFHTTIQVLFWIKAGFYTTAHIDTHKTICVLIFLTLPLMHFFVFRSVDSFFFCNFTCKAVVILWNIDPLSQWRDTSQNALLLTNR